MGFQQEHQFNDDVGHFRTHTAGMALHQILLKCTQFVRGDVAVAEGAEAGGDAIERLFRLLDFPVQVVAAPFDAFLGFGSKFQFEVLVDNPFDDFEGEVFRPYQVDVLVFHNPCCSLAYNSRLRSCSIVSISKRAASSLMAFT